MNVNWKKVAIKVAGVGVGTIGANMVANMLPGTITDQIKGLILLGIGAIAPEFVKGDFVSHVGTGLIAVGTQKLAKSFGMVGIGNAEVEYTQEARNNAIESANQQVAEYIAAVNELEQEVAGLAEEANMVAGPEDENMVAEDVENLAYAM